jgi:Uma2 family endonuclease
LKSKRDQRGAEADECYVFGPTPRAKRRPDLVIEVIWTSGGIDKLKVYRKLGAREVWYYEKGRVQVYLRRGAAYEAAAASEALPGIDLDQLASFLDRPTASQAIRDYRAALR